MDEEFSSALLTGCVLLASGCWALPGKTCRAIHPAPCRSACRRRRARSAPAPTNERSSHAPGLSWSATRSSWPLPTTSHDDGQVQTDASAGPAPPAPASSTRLRLRQTTSRAWTQPATTPTPAIPAVRRPAPPPRSRTSRRPDTADTATHKHRTPTPDAGQRTPDSGHLDTQTPAPDTGQRSRGQQAWTLAARTGHRTPDTGRGRGQADEGAAGIRTSWATTPSDRALGRPTVFLWTAPAALGSPCRLGEAASAR